MGEEEEGVCCVEEDRATTLVISDIVSALVLVYTMQVEDENGKKPLSVLFWRR